MDLIETIKKRQSVRAFQSRPVEADKLQTLLETVNLAPSAGNLQGYRIFIIHAAQLKKDLAAAALGQEFIAQAPVLLLFCADRGRSGAQYRERGEQLYSLQDATIATAYAQLVAVELGLATCWIGAFNDEMVCQTLHLPKSLRPIALLPLGYATGGTEPTPRRPLSEMVVDLAKQPIS